MSPAEASDGFVLVDTDVATWLMSKRDRWEEFEPLLRGRPLAISFVTYAEYMAQAYVAGSQLGERRVAELRQRLGMFVVVPFNIDVAENWARLYPKVKGHLPGGGANDVWIASCALAVDPPLPVVTGNVKDFQAIAAHAPTLRLIHPDPLSVEEGQ